MLALFLEFEEAFFEARQKRRLKMRLLLIFSAVFLTVFLTGGFRSYGAAQGAASAPAYGMDGGAKARAVRLRHDAHNFSTLAAEKARDVIDRMDEGARAWAGARNSGHTHNFAGEARKSGGASAYGLLLAESARRARTARSGHAHNSAEANGASVMEHHEGRHNGVIDEGARAWAGARNSGHTHNFAGEARKSGGASAYGLLLAESARRARTARSGHAHNSAEANGASVMEHHEGRHNGVIDEGARAWAGARNSGHTHNFAGEARKSGGASPTIQWVPAHDLRHTHRNLLLNDNLEDELEDSADSADSAEKSPAAGHGCGCITGALIQSGLRSIAKSMTFFTPVVFSQSPRRSLYKVYFEGSFKSAKKDLADIEIKLSGSAVYVCKKARQQLRDFDLDYRAEQKGTVYRMTPLSPKSGYKILASLNGEASPEGGQQQLSVGALTREIALILSKAESYECAD